MGRIYVACTVALLLACTAIDRPEIGIQTEGQPCTFTADCEAGLRCQSKTCAALEPLEPSGRGQACSSDSTCHEGLFCSRQHVCTGIAPKQVGAFCGITEDCAAPLVCDGNDGVCANDDGTAGTYDFGESCSDMLDCRRPYICGLTNTCTKIPLYLGPDCRRSEQEAGAFRVYFELPHFALPENELAHATAEPQEFYRLPFPNDVRRPAGAINLSGHPSPGQVVGIDLARTYFQVVEEDADGFATNAPIFFRFSDFLEPESLCLSSGSVYPEPPDANEDPDAEPVAFCKNEGAANIYLVNIDPSSPQYNQHIPVQMAHSRTAGTYICQNWLGIAPLDGMPLRQSTLYAAVVTTGVRDIRNAAPLADRHFAEFLAGEREILAMQPLRTWLDEQSIDPNTIAAATVFTTGAPSAIAPALRHAVHAEAEPTFDNNAVVCDAAVVSPCDDGLLRGCSPAHPNFIELQGTYSSPMLQAGTRPYNLPADGGAFVYQNGLPVVQGSESLCYALALPADAMPAAGWPVVLYSHGTGGDYRSAMLDGTAETLTALGFAVLGIDNVSHGPRQGGSATSWDPDPGRLFFNLLNPRASRDNVLQGAADLFQQVRLVRAASITTVDAGAVHFDAAHVYFLGHSQGTVVAPAFLAAEENIWGAVLSGAGAELPLSILHKKQPGDVSRLAGIFFGDSNLSRIHPMMGILALLFGQADAVNFAHLWLQHPPAPRAATPLLHIMGRGDGYTPDITQNALVRAMGIPLVQPVVAALGGVAEVPSPAQNNVGGTTAGAVQLLPDGAYDGHFVLFQHPEGAFLLERFLGSALGGAIEIERQP